MSEIKRVISVLCKILTNLVDEDIKAEHFRLAKFNKVIDNTVVHLWNLLHKLCCKKVENSPCQDGSGDIVTCVKLCFASALYNNFLFYCLPIDMSSGSRELLLALGWLIADINIIEIKMIEFTKSTTVIKEDNLHCSENDLQPTNRYNFTNQPENVDDLYNCIIWLVGRIKHNVRSISNMISEKNNLIAKVQKTAEDKYNIPSLCVEQVELLQNPDKLSVKIDDLKSAALVLESYKYFINKQHVFWEWMESVIIEADENKTTECHYNEDFDKFIQLLNRQIKVEIMKDSSQDSNKIKEIMQLNFLNNSDDVMLWLSKIDGWIERLNGSIENKVSGISKLLENMKTSFSW